MVAQEIEPGTTVISTHYFHTVEEQSASDHEQRIDTEVKLLCAEQEKRQLLYQAVAAQLKAEQAARAQHDAELRMNAQHNYEEQITVTWRRRFIGLACISAVIIAVLLLILFWGHIEAWFR